MKIKLVCDDVAQGLLFCLIKLFSKRSNVKHILEFKRDRQTNLVVISKLWEHRL